MQFLQNNPQGVFLPTRGFSETSTAQNFRHVIFKIELVHNFVEGLELRQ